MKNVTELRNKLLKMEGGKKQISVAQMSEVLACLSDLIINRRTGKEILLILFKNGIRRSKKK